MLWNLRIELLFNVNTFKKVMTLITQTLTLSYTHKKNIALSAGAVEYTDCTSAEG